MMTPDEARELRKDCDDYVAFWSRQPKRALANIYRLLLAEQGRQLLGGGPVTKDEYLSAITGIRFPVARRNEANHVLYHRPGESWPACEWCHPHAGAECQCSAGRVAR